MNNLIITSTILGAGLAMDAFSVSLANGLAETKMKFARVSGIAGTFALFQFLMPLIGWGLVHTAVNRLMWLNDFVPWIALILLSLIGLKMIRDGVIEAVSGQEGMEGETLGAGMLLVQGVATSIDALSVGFAISDHSAAEALLSSAIIGVITFGLCVAGVMIGKKAGAKMAWVAPVTGGILLIIIGLRIAL